MAAYFAIDYTIHFDDTMAYGGHHFLTAFKLQCASREAFLFGELIFDQPGVKEALQEVHLLTSDAYARNLQSMRLGDRVAILLSLEQWGRASARFCYRVLDQVGNRVCAGFQTLICADAHSGDPQPLPTAVSDAMNRLRDIEESRSNQSFRDIVLAGGHGLDELFGETEREIAVSFLSDRYPRPAIVQVPKNKEANTATNTAPPSIQVDESAAEPDNSIAATSVTEAWVFAGQGSYDENLVCERLCHFVSNNGPILDEIQECEKATEAYFGDAARELFSGDRSRCQAAVVAEPGLTQVAILLQNILGARLWKLQGHSPTLFMGHSFGEIAAFHMAGCFDLATAIRIVCLRHQFIELYAPSKSGLLAVFAERHQVRIESHVLGLPKVCIAGRNHDMQTVASGPLDQLECLDTHLRNLGIRTSRLQSPTSFHHPDLIEASRHWYAAMSQFEMQPPVVKIFSPIGRRMVLPTDDLAGTLASQLLRPFDLQGSLHDLAAMGISHVVDCGSTGWLAKLLEKAGQDMLDVCCVATFPAKGMPLQKLEMPAKDIQKLPQPLALIHDKAVRKHPLTAIVGRGCILPAGAVSPEQLFESVTQQRVGLIDQRTLDPHWTDDFYSEKLVPDKSTSHLSGRIRDADIVSPPGVEQAFFESLTRTQKLLCIAMSPCLRGLHGAERVVCLMGATADGFEDQDEATSLVYANIDPLASDVDHLMHSARSGYRTPHQAIQYVLDRIVRPGIQVILVDAACASSLYTTALGMRMLETHRADAVIVGGVFCPGPGNSCLFSQFRGTTSTGCRPFDANADGVVFSEGAAILTLRRCTDALNLGLKVDAIIRGAGLSSDGRSSSANVPQSHGQILSLQRCYRRYSIDPASIAGIEGHGTSTPVGDSTEVETLRQFFAPYSKKPIALHSLKGSIGHAGWAAGTASVIAACEYLHHQSFPAQGFYCKPSQALENAKSVLHIPLAPISLGSKQTRIAVDGFGFGGANAHLVIEKFDPTTTESWNASVEIGSEQSNTLSRSEEIVLIALHEIEPTDATHSFARFDRNAIKLPNSFVVLPELADDMDISQTLTVLLVDQLIRNLPGFDTDLRNETCIVLAMNGKTERGVEATTRVLSNRLKRNLSPHREYVEQIERAFNRSRPSKAYTLQCMMPNVASGRAALLHNLRGANFVVDSGDQSLDAALLTASLLLQNDVNAKVALVASVSACSGADPHNLEKQKDGEHAFAFALTTRAVAEKFDWKPLIELDQVRNELQSRSSGNRSTKRSTSKFSSILKRIRGKELKTDDSVDARPDVAKEIETAIPESCPIHTPVWVEQPFTQPSMGTKNRVPNRMLAALFVVPTDARLVAELFRTLSQKFLRSRIIMLGDDASPIIEKHPGKDLHWVDSLDDPGVFSDMVGSFSADCIIAVQRPRTNDFLESLNGVANDNLLCEAVFLAAKKEVERLNAGKLELWSLVVDGWSGEVHPCSGATAGLLKSIYREIPSARMGTVSTRGLSFEQALDGLLNDRRESGLDTEIVLDGARRLVRRLMPVVYLDSPKPQVTLNSKSVVIATGGARGVTAVMLEAIIRDFGCTVIALGRSELESGPVNMDDAATERDYYLQFVSEHPQSNPVNMRREFGLARARWEAARNVQFLRSIGGNVEYHAVDVTDPKHVSTFMADIASRFGRVDLLIHGAGVQVSTKLQHRSLFDFRKTYNVKVHGLNLLVNSCFKHFGKRVAAHLLTSAYSIFGNDGQHDYGAANETLDRLCAASRQTTAGTWTSLAWLAWDGVGMTRGSEYRALAKQRSLSGIDEATGQRLFRGVISGRTGASINVPLSPAEHTKYAVPTIPRPDDILSGQWIEIPVDLKTIACLPYHKVREAPTLPGAWILHHFVEAASKLCPNSENLEEACVQQIVFHRFVKFQNQLSPNLRVIARKTDQYIHVWLIADLLHSSGQILAKDLHFASAKLEFRSHASLPRTLDDPGFDSHAIALEDPYCCLNSTVDLSGPFRCLREISINEDSRRAVFKDDCNCDWKMTTPALALDAAWRVGAMYADSRKNTLFVPVKIEEVILPIGSNTAISHPNDWTIVSTRPRVAQDGTRWSRTEVCDENGHIKIIVKNAFARQIH